MRMNRKMLVAGLLSGLSLISLGAAAQMRGSRAQSGGMVIFRVGQTVPSEMLTGDNVIKNVSHYHLHQAQDGYEWIHASEGNVLLVSTKSHIVAKIEYRPNIASESK
jgi:Ni/Co efflux regulator RcnB